jgi:predicted PurR-regulated permease PerM
VLVAWVISMIGAPVMTFVRKYLGRSSAAIITLSVFLFGGFALVWFVIPPLVSQIQNLNKVDFNKVITSLEEPIKDWENWLVDKSLMIPAKEPSKSQDGDLVNVNEKIYSQIVVDTLTTQDRKTPISNIAIHVHIPADKTTVDEPAEKNEKQFFTFLKSQLVTYLNPKKIQGIFNDFLTGFGDIVIAIFSIFFISFFFLREQGLFVDFIKTLTPRIYEEQSVKVVDETSHLLIRYFVGILFQAIIITTLVSFGLLAMGIKNALLIGFFAGILNVIPYIGPLVAAGIGVLITISSNLEGSFYDQLVPNLTKLLVVFVLVRFIDDVFLQPKIFSKSVKAHPLEIFLVVMIGAKVGGVVGMLLAIPFYTAARVFGKIFLSEFKIIQKLTGHL